MIAGGSAMEREAELRPVGPADMPALTQPVGTRPRPFLGEPRYVLTISIVLAAAAAAILYLVTR